MCKLSAASRAVTKALSTESVLFYGMLHITLCFTHKCSIIRVDKLRQLVLYTVHGFKSGEDIALNVITNSFEV